MSINLDLENTISFERPLTRVVKQNIRIENPHSKPIAFKVKTTAPKLYCVRPNSDIIPPHQSADVQIMLQAFREEPALDIKCKDKFLILSTLVEGPLEQMSLQDLWTHVESKAKNTIHERKLRCVYTQPAETNTTKTTAPVAAAAPAAASNEKTNTSVKDNEAAEKLKLMEAELNKYKKEVETLREAEPVVVERVQVQRNGFPFSIFLLFALLAAAVAYFLKNN